MAGENTEPLPASVWAQRTAEKLSLSSPTGSLFRDPVEEEQVIKWFSQHFVLRSEFQAGATTRISVKQDEAGPDEGEQRASQNEQTRRPSWLESRDSNSLTEYTLEESVWDAMFFLGMRETGTLGSLLTAFAVVVNVVLQVFFLLVINHTVVEKSFTDEDLRGLAAWRNQVGHDMKYVNSLTGLSLVDRVCARDPTLEVSTDQVHKLGVIEEYLPQGDTDTLFQGPTMCLVALAIWTLVCLKEVSVTMDLMRAVARLPSGKSQGSAFRTTEGGGLELVQVHPYRKLAAIVVTIIRLSVVGALYVIGLKYLANTVSISDLILNAGALEMVMTIDELVFAAMIPARVAALTRSLATLPMLPWRECRGADVKSLLAPIILIACLLFLWYGELRTAISNINEARDILCRGNRSFGFEKDGLEVVRVKGLNPIAHLDSNDNMDVWAVTDVSHPLTAAGPSWKFGLPWTLQSQQAPIIQDMDYNSINHMMATVQDVYAAVDTNNCSDSPEQYWNVSQWRLAKSLGIPGPLASCEQVRPYCRFFDGQTLRSVVMLRALCPRTCGCNSMLSGTAFISPELGCPKQCLLAVAPEERRSAPCDNMNLTDPADPRLPWLLEWVGEVQSHLPSINLTRMVKILGCGLVQFMRAPPPGFEDKTAPIDFCESADGSLHYARYGDGNAVRGRTLKLMTFFCPRTCNCDGHSSTVKRPPEKFCPERCSA